MKKLNGIGVAFYMYINSFSSINTIPVKSAGLADFDIDPPA